jgi:hypothetical protein
VRWLGVAKARVHLRAGLQVCLTHHPASVHESTHDTATAPALSTLPTPLAQASGNWIFPTQLIAQLLLHVVGRVCPAGRQCALSSVDGFGSKSVGGSGGTAGAPVSTGSTCGGQATAQSRCSIQAPAESSACPCCVKVRPMPPPSLASVCQCVTVMSPPQVILLCAAAEGAGKGDGAGGFFGKTASDG